MGRKIRQAGASAVYISTTDSAKLSPIRNDAVELLHILKIHIAHAELGEVIRRRAAGDATADDDDAGVRGQARR